MTNSRERFLDACAGRPVDRPPVWLMRQAGRALPEYRALKEKHTFLELVRTPELAAEVTLQPVRRFGFDAAILFSDILVIPEALGQPYHFREGGGIEMSFPIRREADFKRLHWSAVGDRLVYVFDALERLRSQLGASTALLGFAGSPWTLANFMIEGGSSDRYVLARTWLEENPRPFLDFLEKLAGAVAEYLQRQIAAGADAVQIFDSLASALDAAQYEEASARWIRAIIAALPAEVPVIVFSRGSHWPRLCETGARVVSLDETVALAEARQTLPASVAIQGNLDPEVLTTTPEQVEAATRACLAAMSGRNGYIFNLGHGVPPGARIENIGQLVETVRQFAWQNSKSTWG
jgi:uroporphyrinogen decarboxylase